jgi:hypothetical protein
MGGALFSASITAENERIQHPKNLFILSAFSAILFVQ